MATPDSAPNSPLSPATRDRKDSGQATGTVAVVHFARTSVDEPRTGTHPVCGGTGMM